MTQKKWSELTETDYKYYASEISKNITIRTYTNDCSNDTTRPSTEDEAAAIYAIVFGAMVAYGHREDTNLNSILDTAEYIGHNAISDTEEVNCYDTIYVPLQKTMGRWA